ncbi:hypothetical protein DSM112329_05463 [Paraconexibacter sp. AEG42_29]|uniref:Uncharacterized protein n=1 Tax=Paraconexibacter sp. AEG42_29 TaxID=2997339 RepID=A0AAU7B3Q3_9ACTN
MARTLAVLVAVFTVAMAATTAEAAYKPNMRAGFDLFTGGPPCNRAELMGGVFAYLPNLSDGQAKAVAKRYKPTRDGSLTVGGKTYKLRRYARMDVARSDFVSWGFHAIKGVPASALGRRATVRYVSAGGVVKASAVVARGTCA